MHPNLKFTKKLEIHRALPFLDMLATRAKSRLQTSWYCKPTDTGLSFSYYAVATSEYNWNIAEGTIHRIHHATSTWEAFNGGLEKATADWERIIIHLVSTPPLFVPLLRSFWRRESTHWSRRLHAKRREAPSSCSIEVLCLTSSANTSDQLPESQSSSLRAS